VRVLAFTPGNVGQVRRLQQQPRSKDRLCLHTAASLTGKATVQRRLHGKPTIATYAKKTVVMYPKDSEAVITYPKEAVITYPKEAVITYPKEAVITYLKEAVITYQYPAPRGVSSRGENSL
jgi:hypothetical protein